jgi:uncharacterized delta-60 repeat protein
VELADLFGFQSGVQQGAIMRKHADSLKCRSVPALIEPLETRQMLSAGQLDPSFGSGGKTTVDFHGLGVQATAVATESDGKTVVVGFANHGGEATDFAIVRLNFDGTPDTTFGPDHNGIVLLHLGDSDAESGAEAVVVDGQNRILVAGSDNITAAVDYNVGGDIYVARYLPNGTLDPSFGSHGISDVDFGVHNDTDARGIALQSDGKIVVVGLNKDFKDNFLGIGNTNFAIARLNANGSLDQSFNDGGEKTVDFDDGDAIANAVAFDYSGTPKSNPHYGTIVVSGFIENFGDRFSRLAAIRIKPDGHLDSSFHGNGQVEFAPQRFTGGIATGVVVQSTGDIVLSGTLGTFSTDGSGIDNGQFALVRLTPSGNGDNTFGTGSDIVTLGFGGADAGDSLVLGPNNRLIVGGSAERLTAVVAFTQNGLLDNSFGSAGKVTTDFNGGTTAALGIAYLGDRIVVAGGGKFDTARYLDTNPNVAAGAIITTASEQGPTPVTFLVTQDQRLPYDNQVNFSIGGTATPPSLSSIKFHTEDYTLSGMNVPLLGLAGHPLPPPSVVIPAGQTFVLVTLTPVDDSIPEGTETASFSVIPNTFYNVAAPSSVNINILDNDTTAKTFGASADSYVQDGSSANTNFGSATSLVVKSGTTGFNRFTYLKFDLSSVSTINSVKLQLFGNLSSSQNASVTTDVFSVADTSWTESGITFNNAPAAGPSPLASTTIAGTAGTKYTWDVTAYVKAQKAAGHNIISFVLKDPLASDSAVIFNSREAAMGPALVIS